MRKYLFFTALAVLATVLCSLVFYLKPAMAQSDQGRQNASPNAAFNHEKVDKEKAAKMMTFFVNNARKADHKFTKFNRQELIEALQAMNDVDSVKFIIGATIDNTPGIPRGKPVIMLQLQETESEQPGGYSALRYSYAVGAICPPPHGKDCVLEQ